jgi:hypothetical protein
MNLIIFDWNQYSAVINTKNYMGFHYSRVWKTGDMDFNDLNNYIRRIKCK